MEEGNHNMVSLTLMGSPTPTERQLSTMRVFTPPLKGPISTSEGAVDQPIECPRHARRSAKDSC